MAKPMMKKIFYPQKSAGFTLIELLVTIMVGGMIISALLFFVVQLTRTDRQELARSETEREMTMAMDYIQSDMTEAVYIYEAECLEGGRGNPNNPNSNYCAGLEDNGLNNIIENNETPVLAFWKLEQLPYRTNPSPNEDIPESCGTTDTDADVMCRRVRLRRNSYTLVVYTISTDLTDNWEGPALLRRYHLREFDPRSLSNPRTIAGYVSPKADGYSFASWPCNTQGLACNMPRQNWDDDTLVDYVDFAAVPDDQECPNNPIYQPISSSVSSNTSFYGCVRPAVGGQGQDAILFLRGNAIKRAGLREGTRDPNSLPTSYLPTIQSQVATRSTFERKIE
jgi:prepilin-type N-terminal cleavage/methylation domain-containing protein